MEKLKPIDRLFQYFDHKRIKPTRFEKENGLSNGYLGSSHKRKSDIGSKIIDLILEKCPDLSEQWLLAGVGDMLKKPLKEEPKTLTQKEIELLKKITDLQEELIESFKRERKLREQYEECNQKLKI